MIYCRTKLNSAIYPYVIISLFFLLASNISCTSIDIAPSGQLSISEYTETSTQQLLAKGEKTTCVGFEEKGGSFKRQYTFYLNNPAESSNEKLSTIKIGENNRRLIRYFGYEKDQNQQVWGETKNSETAIRVYLSQKLSAQNKPKLIGKLKIFDVKGGTKVSIENVVCK